MSGNLPRIRRPGVKIDAGKILEAVHDLDRPSTIMEIADKAGCSRNSATDRLSDLWVQGLVSRARLESLRGTGKTGRRPLVFDVTRYGRDRVAKMRHLALDVDLETQGERFDRAAEILEAEATAIEARMTKEPAIPEVDPRQIALPIEIEIPGFGAANQGHAYPACFEGSEPNLVTRPPGGAA